MHEMWWCVVVDACACACTTPNLHQPGLYCTIEILLYLPYFAVWVDAATQHLQKLTLGLRMLHGKNEPKTPITSDCMHGMIQMEA